MRSSATRARKNRARELRERLAGSIIETALEAAKAKGADGLVAGRVIASLSKDVKRRKAFGSAKLNFDFAPASIVRSVAWMVSQYILVTQLHANFSGDVREILELFD